MTSQTIYEGKLITVVVEDGMEIVRHRDAASVLAVDGEGMVTFVRQRRPAVGLEMLELPAGLIDEGETPLDAARRELREETGLHGGVWEAAASFYLSPGFCDEQMHVFIAREVEQGDASPEESEDLETVRVPGSGLASLLPQIENAQTLAGVLLFLHR